MAKKINKPKTKLKRAKIKKMNKQTKNKQINIISSNISLKLFYI